MSKRRFIASIVKTAETEKAECAWHRGAVRTATIAKRKTVARNRKRA